MGREDEAPSFPEGAGIDPAGKRTPLHPGGPVAQDTEVSRMRTRLIEELRTPFIEHVKDAPSDIFIKQVKVENFDERVMTLPDKEIFGLYVDYLKTRRIENETTKKTVRKSILDRLELSFFSEGWFLGRILKRR